MNPLTSIGTPSYWIRYRCPCCHAGHAVQLREAGSVRRCRDCRKAVRIPSPRPDEIRRARTYTRRLTRAG